MRQLPATLYIGKAFDPNAAAVIPNNKDQLAALWLYCESGTLTAEIRRVHQAIYVPPHTFLQAPIDIVFWHKKAAEKFPSGLPEPSSDDPTQWLFHGHPRYAKTGTELHVLLARLAGYRWPAESDTDMRLSAAARTHIAEATALLADLGRLGQVAQAK